MGRLIDIARHVYAKILWSRARQRTVWELRQQCEKLARWMMQNMLRVADDYVLPKTIFTYWDDEALCPIVKANIDTWRRKLPEWRIVVLHDGNVTDYVSHVFVDRYKGKMEHQRYSDYLRLELLERYGGTWMDAGIFVVNPSFLNDMYAECQQWKYDACFFELSTKTRHPEYPFLESWFIMASCKSKLIKDWNRELTRAFRVGFISYKKNVLVTSGMDISNTVGRFYEDTYLMIHATLNYLFYMGKKYNVKVYEACESLFKIHQECDFNAEKVAQTVLDRAESGEWADLYAVKLCRLDRKAIYTMKAVDKYVALLGRV